MSGKRLLVDGPYPTCEAALAALRWNRPDYAVASVDLRQGPCFALACALRQADVPFMLFSGSVPVLPAFRDVPVIEHPCLDDEVVASLSRALQVRIRQGRLPERFSKVDDRGTRRWLGWRLPQCDGSGCRGRDEVPDDRGGIPSP